MKLHVSVVLMTLFGLTSCMQLEPPQVDFVNEVKPPVESPSSRAWRFHGGR